VVCLVPKKGIYNSSEEITKKLIMIKRALIVNRNSVIVFGSVVLIPGLTVVLEWVSDNAYHDLIETRLCAFL
jgi:hypothetical protein